MDVSENVPPKNHHSSFSSLSLEARNVVKA